ncbi:uncharacterized protein F4822DRAFT_418793 [Hypoxylon trugodes]|uniref:uncharacterized protein n=1 Tax=Hypoxylon trugodes TaxID=326681 RepID=UPI0021966D33|nr:uncharacterized protein F4822DRAFT_418793 [Hypoxylon trugodes]KAI1384126.1 hypothetical protein F4822DRAFT_418793 [Hypoxylon trugodes]
MRLSSLYCIQLLAATASAQLVALPFKLRPQPSNQQPLMDPVGPVVPPSKQPAGSKPQPPPSQGGVLISDVMGRDRSINIFAGFTRDIESISSRLDDSSKNSTVLAPRNSAVDQLPRKPWEDPKDYEALGANAYEGGDGQDRAHRNLRRFVEAHVVPFSPWPENEKVKTLLDGDREIWWETKDGVKTIQPDGIEIDSIASRVGNGELWIIRGVRNYA